MRPTPLRRFLTFFLPGALALGGVAAGGYRSACADAPAWERPIRLGMAEQDAEIARSSAKASATRLESQASRNRQDFVVLYLLARAYGKDNRRADAITAYGEAIGIETGCWFAWRDRGVLRWLEKDLKGAEQDLRQAVALNPRMLEALQPLGALLIEEKRYADGIRVLTQALDVDPGLDSARLQVADAFLALGVPDNAIQTLEPLLKKFPKDVSLRVARARYLTAKQDYAGAQAIFKQLAIENPNDAGPLNAWLAIAVKSKTLDADEGVWVLEQLRRLARNPDDRAKLTKEIADLRRHAAEAAGPPAPQGPPTAADLVRALRASDVRAREGATFYILTGVPESFTITGELATALIERLKVASGADVPAKGEDSPRVRAFALEILARYGTPDFASIVRLSLRDPDGNVRRKAADALGQLKNPLAIAALWRYAKGEDLDLALSAQQAVYLLSKQAEPEAEPTAEAHSAAFFAWWNSPQARDAKLGAIAAVLASADRAVDELLFPFAFLDADEAVAGAGYQGLKSLAKIAEQAATDAKAKGAAVPAGIDWMKTLPIFEGKPHKHDALGAWWLRRPQ